MERSSTDRLRPTQRFWAAEHVHRALFFGVLATVGGYLLLGVRDPLRLNWGDPWSDANVLTALNYSSRYGFFQTSFTDVLDIGPLTEESYRYTHYPPFSEILHGCVRKLAGGQALDISTHRGVALVFAAIGLRSFYGYVAQLWGQPTARWATALCATNLLWIQFADSVHQSPILFGTGMLALSLVPEWLRERRRWHGLAIGLAAGCCFLTAYDYYFFLPITALLTARACGIGFWSKPMRRLFFLLAGAGAIAIALKSIFVIGVLGWGGFLEDLHFQFFERATTRFAPDYRQRFLTVLVVRWLAYFTPIPFVATGLLVFRLLQNLRKVGWRRALRSFVVGDGPLDEDASVLLLLVGGLPFLVIFSELAVEQVLPSQVLVPFVATVSGSLLARVARARPPLAYVGFVATLSWTILHGARCPKAFLDRESTARIREYLKAHDSNDFVVTNLLSEGPIQYYFERHAVRPVESVAVGTATYSHLFGRVPSGVAHAIQFDDPNSRFVDKSLWSLLVPRGAWTVYGAPYVFREEALSMVGDYDRRVELGLLDGGEVVLRLPGIRLFRLSAESLGRRIPQPTPSIDFGAPEGDLHKERGFRYREQYDPDPAFSWATGYSPLRTVLTARGLEFRDRGTVAAASVVLHLDRSRDHQIRVHVWPSSPQQLLSASVSGQPVLERRPLGEAFEKEWISFAVPRSVGRGLVLERLEFSFPVPAASGSNAWVAFSRLDVETVE